MTPRPLFLASFFDHPAGMRDRDWFRANPDARWQVRPRYRDECTSAAEFRTGHRLLIVRLPDSPRYPTDDRTFTCILEPGDDPATIAARLLALTDEEMYGPVDTGRVGTARVLNGGA